MPARRPSGKTKKQGKGPTASGWAGLTWGDLESWAGSRSVTRGRSYQRGGQVKDLAITGDGDLLATVTGGDHYAVTVTLKAGDRATSLESSCTCPVGYDGCKHAVATVADYLQALADGREVPVAAEGDPRWEQLENRDDDEPWEDDEVDEDEPPVTRRRVDSKPSRRGKTAANWDAKIEQEIRSKSREELAGLVLSLTQRFPDLYQEFRERIALREGDVARLVAETRADIRRTTSETAWRNSWSGEGHTPDYSRIRHRLERLVEVGHADEVVDLGRDLIEQGLRQVADSHDEGEASKELSGCLPVVFQAVTRSSLSGPERLLFAIDAHLADDYGMIDAASEVILDASFPADYWSVAADALLRRIKAMPVGDPDTTGDYSRKYHRDRLTDWAIDALREAGREGEVQAILEGEARATGSYQRLVKFLMAEERFDDAERRAREGIAAVAEHYAGIRSSLMETLRELAEKRKQWDVVAAHAACDFFEGPSAAGFERLIKAAKKAKLEEPVRTAALHFLETGAKPYQVASPPAPTMTRAPSARKKAATTRMSARNETIPEPSATLKIDSSWPLPVPDYLIPVLGRRAVRAQEPRPHLEVLLQMAIADKRPDEVLRWYDKMGTVHRHVGNYADQTAAAVANSHPERAMAIYRKALDALLPHADQAAYASAVGYLRKLCPIYKSLKQEGEWTALVASIRETYRNRPRFMELLDGLEHRTIIQSVRPRRK